MSKKYRNINLTRKKNIAYISITSKTNRKNKMVEKIKSHPKET